MAFPVVDLIAEFFYSIFGSGIIMSFVIVSVFIMILVALKAPLSVMLAVIIPVVMGLILNTAGSNFIEFQPWILIVLLIMAGFIFSLFFLFFVR